MRLQLFFKLAVVAAIVSLAAYAFSPEGIGFLAKALALGLAVSMAFAAFYPDIRGVRRGDSIMLSSSMPFLAARLGTALTGGKKNGQIRVRFENGEEAVAVVEDCAGLITPPTVRLLYQERLNE